MSLVLHGEPANSQTHMVNEKVHHDFKSNRKALFYYERDIKTHSSIKRAVRNLRIILSGVENPLAF